MDTEIISMTDIEKEKVKVKKIRKEVEETQENVSKLKLISNQILTGLEKDFASSQQQHIANVRRDMNDQLNKKDREIQQLREDKKDAESKLRSMRDSVLAAIGK